MTTREQTAEALTAAAATNIRTRARAGKPLPHLDQLEHMTIRERLALEGIELRRDGDRYVWIDAANGEPIVTLAANGAADFAGDFVVWAQEGRDRKAEVIQ